VARSKPAAAAQPAQAVAPAAPSPESRLADLTARLRADTNRMAERMAQADAQRPAAPVQAAASQPMQRPESVERAALAAIAAAVAPTQAAATPPVAENAGTYGDVTVRPVAPKPTLFVESSATVTEMHEPPAAAAFIPPAAEKITNRTPRMPKFDELPMPAQAEIRKARGEAVEEHPQKNRLSLLQRLANVGLGRRDEETEPPIAARTAGPAMPQLPDRPASRPLKPQAPVSEYAPRPAPQGLDSHGRPAPANPQPPGDDHLDIPAFLRRQST
jgi:cell division protein FtsZ